MIETTHLTKRFRQVEAVSDLCLSIQEGEVFGFLGPNGAGKTTTIRLMMGTLKPTSGSVRLGGFDLSRSPLEAKRITGFVPDRPYLYDKLTGLEFLLFIAGLHSLSRAEERIQSLLEFFELAAPASELIESYSHGMKQRLALAGALVHSPRILIIDEPMVGIDPKGARDLKRLFRALAAEGLTLFLSTHSLAVAEEVCDRIGIIHNGRLIAVGTMQELRSKVADPEGGLELIFFRLTGADLSDSARMNVPSSARTG